MRNAPDTTWTPLFESDDLRQARMVATCVAAMEYEVRLEGRDDAEHGPFTVRVTADDWAQLTEVLDEIIREQEQFDVFIDRWRLTASKRERRLLVAMIIIVSSLAVVGAIEV